MDQTPKTILLKILDIIDYKDDKEVFSHKFFNLVAQQTLGDLVLSLPDDKKKAVEGQLSAETDPIKLKQIFNSSFTKEQVDEVTLKVTHKAFQDYTRAIVPVLTPDQKQRLQELVDIKTSEANSVS